MMSAATVLAQGVQTGTLRVTVLDTQERVMDHVNVTVKSPALLGTRTAITDDEGRVALTALPPGDYELTLERANFRPSTLAALVSVGAEAEYRVTMQIAAITGPDVLVTPTPVAAGGGLEVRQEVGRCRRPRSDVDRAAFTGRVRLRADRGLLTINDAPSVRQRVLVNGVDVDDSRSATRRTCSSKTRSETGADVRLRRNAAASPAASSTRSRERREPDVRQPAPPTDESGVDHGDPARNVGRTLA
jgi:hypothetical protein